MTINQYDFNGKKAIVRVDFNVPLKEGKITDDTRIRGAVPTLKLILEKGGALIIMSHMGKPKGKVKPELSLGQIKDAVAAALGVEEVKFAPDCAKAQEAAEALKPGEVLLLENLRYYPEEEGKPVGIDKADPAYDEAKKAMKVSQKAFAKTLASYADCYVMDAFGTAHRKHLQLLLPTTSMQRTRCSVFSWRRRLLPLTPYSEILSVRLLPSWVVQRFHQRLVSLRTFLARLTSSSSAVA